MFLKTEVIINIKCMHIPQNINLHEWFVSVLFFGGMPSIENASDCQLNSRNLQLQCPACGK